MVNNFKYPALFESNGNNGFIVSFRDVKSLSAVLIAGGVNFDTKIIYPSPATVCIADILPAASFGNSELATAFSAYDALSWEGEAMT